MEKIKSEKREKDNRENNMRKERDKRKYFD